MVGPGGIDRIEAHRVWEELGVDGSGVRVATLGTGVDMAHHRLEGRMVTDDPADPTHGASMDDDADVGVAPGAVALIDTASSTTATARIRPAPASATAA